MCCGSSAASRSEPRRRARAPGGEGAALNRDHFPPALLGALAARYGTPLFVLDLDVARTRLAALDGFDRVRYAQKANANPALLAALREGGAVIDAVSAGEIRRAGRAGFGPDEIVFTADLFTEDALAEVVARDVTPNLGSEDMIEQYAAAGGRRAVWLRVNPGFGHGHHRRVDTGGPGSKHGIWHEELPAALARLDAAGLALRGLHLHVGSGSDLEHLRRVADAMVELARRAGRPLEGVSAGGGLPVAHRPEETPLDLAAFTATWRDAAEAIGAATGRRPALEVEPGRFLVADAGVLLARVRAVKRVAGRRFVLVDAGFHNLSRHLLYGAWHEISAPRATGKGEPEEVVIAGPLCESSDVFTLGPDGEIRPRLLPALAVGDLVALHDAGAYAASMASHYNAMPLAAEVALSGGEVVDHRPAREAPEAGR
ncbi:MAG: diaminopimelate decarboxylase [Planctomycetota bacterium]